MKDSLLPNLQRYLAPWCHFSTGGVGFACIAFLAVSAVILQICFSHYFHLKEEVRKESLKIEKLKTENQLINEFERIKKQMPDVFAAFEKSHFCEELNLDILHTYFQRWQKQYKVTFLHLKFGNQVPYDKGLNLWRMPVVVNLKALKDNHVYEILHLAQIQLPGKVILKQFSLKRTAALTKEMLKEIRLGEGNVNLFEGKIEFDWIYKRVN